MKRLSRTKSILKAGETKDSPLAKKKPPAPEDKRVEESDTWLEGSNNEQSERSRPSCSLALSRRRFKRQETCQEEHIEKNPPSPTTKTSQRPHRLSRRQKKCDDDSDSQVREKTMKSMQKFPSASLKHGQLASLQARQGPGQPELATPKKNRHQNKDSTQQYSPDPQPQQSKDGTLLYSPDMPVMCSQLAASQDCEVVWNCSSPGFSADDLKRKHGDPSWSDTSPAVNSTPLRPRTFRPVFAAGRGRGKSSAATNLDLLRCNMFLDQMKTKIHEDAAKKDKYTDSPPIRPLDSNMESETSSDKSMDSPQLPKHLTSIQSQGFSVEYKSRKNTGTSNDVSDLDVNKLCKDTGTSNAVLNLDASVMESDLKEPGENSDTSLDLLNTCVFYDTQPIDEIVTRNVETEKDFRNISKSSDKLNVSIANKNYKDSSYVRSDQHLYLDSLPNTSENPMSRRKKLSSGSELLQLADLKIPEKQDIHNRSSFPSSMLVQKKSVPKKEKNDWEKENMGVNGGKKNSIWGEQSIGRTNDKDMGSVGNRKNISVPCSQFGMNETWEPDDDDELFMTLPNEMLQGEWTQTESNERIQVENTTKHTYPKHIIPVKTNTGSVTSSDKSINSLSYPKAFTSTSVHNRNPKLANKITVDNDADKMKAKLVEQFGETSNNTNNSDGNRHTSNIQCSQSSDMIDTWEPDDDDELFMSLPNEMLQGEWTETNEPTEENITSYTKSRKTPSKMKASVPGRKSKPLLLTTMCDPLDDDLFQDDVLAAVDEIESTAQFT